MWIVALILCGIVGCWLGKFAAREMKASEERMQYAHECRVRAAEAWNLYLAELKKDEERAKAQKKRQAQRYARRISKNFSHARFVRRIRLARRIFHDEGYNKA